MGAAEFLRGVGTGALLAFATLYGAGVVVGVLASLVWPFLFAVWLVLS